MTGWPPAGSRREREREDIPAEPGAQYLAPVFGGPLESLDGTAVRFGAADDVPSVASSRLPAGLAVPLSP